MFLELEQFAPELVPTEIARARHFEEGLRPQIRIGVRHFKFKTLAKVVDIAKLIEVDIYTIQQELNRAYQLLPIFSCM